MKAFTVLVISACLPAMAVAQSGYRSAYRASSNGSAYSQPYRSSYGNTYSPPVHVNSYTRSDGTYVQPHYRTSADDSRFNNYSTKGNVNPYTGAPGTKDPYGGY